MPCPPVGMKVPIEGTNSLRANSCSRFSIRNWSTGKSIPQKPLKYQGVFEPISRDSPFAGVVVPRSARTSVRRGVVQC